MENRFIQPVDDIRVVSREKGPRTLLPAELLEIGRQRVAAGEPLEEVAQDLAFYEASLLPQPEELRSAGGKGSGNFGHAGRKGEVGGSDAAGGGTAKVRNERSLRALKAFIPVHAETQRHCKANELEIRKMVGGVRTTDNLPVDVITEINGKVKGIEVKTMVNNTNDKITMRKAALEKKTKWARSNHASVHTVVVDDRGKFGHGHYSGHRVYYRKGTGSFRLSQMTKVRSAAHLKELLSK